ncbi:MAG: hypothetical protein QXT00_09365 [Ignisphaera sp.]
MYKFNSNGTLKFVSALITLAIVLSMTYMFTYESVQVVSQTSTVEYFIRDGKVWMRTADGERAIYITGVNWFGFETPDYVVHGLWARN